MFSSLLLLHSLSLIWKIGDTIWKIEIHNLFWTELLLWPCCLSSTINNRLRQVQIKLIIYIYYQWNLLLIIGLVTRRHGFVSTFWSTLLILICRLLLTDTRTWARITKINLTVSIISLLSNFSCCMSPILYGVDIQFSWVASRWLFGS